MMSTARTRTDNCISSLHSHRQKVAAGGTGGPSLYETQTGGPIAPLLLGQWTSWEAYWHATGALEWLVSILACHWCIGAVRRQTGTPLVHWSG